jgi:hypothetical protein
MDDGSELATEMRLTENILSPRDLPVSRSSESRDKVLEQLGCSGSDLDALVGNARLGTWKRLNKFLQDSGIGWNAARTILERSMCRPDRRNTSYLLAKDIDWIEENSKV